MLTAEANHVLVLGIPVTRLSMSAMVAQVSAAPRMGVRLAVHFCNAHSVVEAAQNPALRDALRHADLVAPDGTPVALLAGLKGRRGGRVPGPDFMIGLMARSSRADRHFFYGGAPDVVETLAEELQAKFPGLLVAGVYSPPYRELSPSEDEEIISRINDARPDFVWVGLGTPRQDLWIRAHRDRLAASVLLAVGAAFDFHAGKVARAPAWIRRVGLEWLFRLTAEPGRLWRRYTIGNVRFLSLVLSDWLRSGWRRAGN